MINEKRIGKDVEKNSSILS